MSGPQSALRLRRKNRIPTSLNHGLDRKLLGYSMAAGAAGVGLMALALPAQAQIVYTATNQTIPPGHKLNLDLNNDGITDFAIANSLATSCFFGRCKFAQVAVSVASHTQNGVASYTDSFAWAVPMLGLVGAPSQHFKTWVKIDRCIATRTSQTSSAWGGKFGSNYLGLKFSIDGQTHYGWARIRWSTRGDCNNYLVLTGYAYQKIAGEPIRAGETVNHLTSESGQTGASLGALAAGSVGLEAWRREETKK